MHTSDLQAQRLTSSMMPAMLESALFSDGVASTELFGDSRKREERDFARNSEGESYIHTWQLFADSGSVLRRKTRNDHDGERAEHCGARIYLEQLLFRC